MEPIVATEFTPWMSLFGGILIGVSAVMVMALLGKIAGIAGITKGVIGAVIPLDGAPGDGAWRGAFVVGLVAAPFVVLAIDGAMPAQTVSANLIGMGVAGLLVGLGTSIGSGCTSGHGVCGLARLSVRSVAAVVVFILAAAATVYVLRHVAGG